MRGKFGYISPIVQSDKDDVKWEYMAFEFPNTYCMDGLKSYKITIDQLRDRTGLKLFPNEFPMETAISETIGNCMEIG